MSFFILLPSILKDAHTSSGHSLYYKQTKLYVQAIYIQATQQKPFYIWAFLPYYLIEKVAHI